MAQTLLKVTGLKVAYGGIQAVKGVDSEVREGELVSLIGSNGAGKTTTMKAITGSLPLAGGDIEYLGKSIAGQGPGTWCARGLAMVPEGRGVFARNEHHREPARAPTSAATSRHRATSTVFTIFPRLRSARTSWPAPCPAASSRCWPWAGR